MVSIIIPTYNRKDLLERTIATVLAQTYTDFELLICDDGSSDGTYDMVSSFDDKRVKWIPGKNSGGPATPRNRGIREARGEWLAFLDSDDLWMPEKLAKQLQAIQTHHVQAVCTNALIMRNEAISDTPYFDRQGDRRYTFKDMIKTNQVICSSMLLHHSIPKKLGGFPEEKMFKAIEDYALWLSASMLTDIYYLCEPLTVYRDEPQNSIRGEVFEDERVKHNRILRECARRISKIQTNKLFYLKTILSFLMTQKFSYYRYKIRSLMSKGFRA